MKLEEQNTYEILLERMLNRVSDDLDKREGGVIWTALAPAAAEQAQMYIWMDTLLELVDANSTAGEYLDRKVLEAGIERYPATKAIRKVEFNIAVENGSRFYVEGLYFYTKKQGLETVVECEDPGVVGNANIDGLTMLPVDTIQGLEVAVIGEIIVPGTEEEEDEPLRERFFVRRRKESVNGNKAQYKEWAEELEGVGKAKVYPLWNGRSTVKIVIVNSDMGPASSELVTAVKDYIDPVAGKGEGVAPIGAEVTVESATIKHIDITATVTLIEGREMEDAVEEIKAAIQPVFKELSFQDELVRIAQINNTIYGVSSVIDYENVKLSGYSRNVPLGPNEIPRLRGVVISVKNR